MYFKLPIFFLQNWGEEVLEIALGISIANQGRTYILNCGRKIFAKVGSSDIFNLTKGSESNHKYRNCNCVIVVKFAT